MFMRPNDLLRRLSRRATKLDLEHVEIPGRGGHLKVRHGGKPTVIPMHNKDIKPNTFRDILKQLGLTERDLEF